MLQSMTGYGHATAQLNDEKISIELKSLNSRYFDLRLNAPTAYKTREIQFRNILAGELNRGKIAMTISVENQSSSQVTLNTDLIQQYHYTLRDLRENLGIPTGDILNTILKIPGIMQESNAHLSEDDWKTCLDTLSEAIQNLTEFRISEGKALEGDMKSRIVSMMNNLDKIENLEGKRIEDMRLRIHEHLEHFIDKADIDQNRFEQELIYYIEKSDITEERIRLRQHFSYFMDILMAPDKVKGRKLDFISQEIGREINTLGAKANYSSIQHLVVNMKDELEKIKEQTANVV